MKPYPAYKDSGIEWIGEIPEHWDVKRLKHVGTSIIGITYSPEDTLNDKSGGLLVLRSSNIQNNKLNLLDTVHVGIKVSQKQIVRIGDILICSRNGSRELIGKNICIDERTEGETFGAFMTVYRSKYFSFMQYFFNSQLFESQSGLYMSSTINQLTLNILNNLSIAFPHPSEQQFITTFLNHKTPLIDTIIEKKQKQIELLKEERTAIINQAVTKGLNPDIPMKDSGIEWLGEVPENWEVKPLKYITKINESVLPESTDKNYLIKYIDIGNVGQGYLINPPNEMIFGDAPSRARRIVKRRDIIISTVRTYLKAITYIDFEDSNLVSSTGFAVISATNNIDSKYLYYMLSSQKFIDTVSSNSVGVSYPAISSTQISLIPVCYPPSIEEQKEFVKLIENDALQIDNIIRIIQNQINLLQEYRTALISNTVTGKIDVRDTPTASLE